MSPQDVWIHIEGYDRNIRAQWEMTRAVAYNIALFGQSDKKKLARSAQKFWSFPWDKEAAGSRYKEIIEQHAVNKAIRETLMKKQS